MPRVSRSEGLHLSRTLSLRVSEEVAATIGKEQLRIESEIEVAVSASEVVRHALEKYLIGSGYELTITPWPSPPKLEEQVKKLEAEVLRLRKLVPSELLQQTEKEPWFE